MGENLPGKRVLIVEDNPILAFDLQDVLEEHGTEAIGPAYDLATGLKLVRENNLDAAFLDIDLGSERVWPIARELAEHGVPFAFVSGGCPEGDVPEDFRGYIFLQKPAMRVQIVSTLSGMVGSERVLLP